MCKIRKETIVKANTRTKNRMLADVVRASSAVNGEVVVFTRHCGIEYSRHVTMSELKASYSRSLNAKCSK